MRMYASSLLAALLLCGVVTRAGAQSFTAHPNPLPNKTMLTATTPDVAQQNKTVVDNFFVALETGRFELLKEVFAPDGRQLNPYVPEGFPRSFDGAEAIYQQYSSLPARFSAMRFPRTIYGTDDPNFFFVVFRGDIDIRAGGKYQNDYLGTFRLEGGKIKEYTEYFNPIVMAKAFNLKLGD